MWCHACGTTECVAGALEGAAGGIWASSKSSIILGSRGCSERSSILETIVANAGLRLLGSCTNTNRDAACADDGSDKQKRSILDRPPAKLDCHMAYLFADQPPYNGANNHCSWL